LGNVYVTGFSTGPASGYDYATIKYNSAGTRQWVARYDGPAHANDYANAIAVDGSGNVYVTGGSGGSGVGCVPACDDYATIKYNSSGRQQWVARYNGSGNGSDDAQAIAIDSSGNVYVTGISWGGSGTFDDYATVKYDTSGTQQWAARYNGPGNSEDVGRAIAVDASGNVMSPGKAPARAPVLIMPQSNTTLRAHNSGSIATTGRGTGMMRLFHRGPLPLMAQEMPT